MVASGFLFLFDDDIGTVAVVAFCSVVVTAAEEVVVVVVEAAATRALPNAVVVLVVVVVVVEVKAVVLARKEEALVVVAVVGGADITKAAADCVRPIVVKVKVAAFKKREKVVERYKLFLVVVRTGVLLRKANIYAVGWAVCAGDV